MPKNKPQLYNVVCRDENGVAKHRIPYDFPEKERAQYVAEQIDKDYRQRGVNLAVLVEKKRNTK